MMGTTFPDVPLPVTALQGFHGLPHGAAGESIQHSLVPHSGCATLSESFGEVHGALHSLNALNSKIGVF